MSTWLPNSLLRRGADSIALSFPFAREQAAPRKLSFTAAAAGFLFSFRIILVMIAARWLNWGTQPGVIAGTIVEIVLLVMVALQVFGPAERLVGWVFRLPCIRWVLVFLAFSCCSLAWSGTTSPVASFMYWATMATDVAIVLLLLRGQGVVDVVHSMMKGYVVASVILAAIAWIIPAATDLRLGDLEYFNTNQIGNVCAMGVFMAQFLASRKDGRWRVSVWFLMLTLIRSLSKATLIAFVVSQGMMLIQDNSITRKRKVVIGVSALALGLAFGGLFESYFSVYTSSGNQAETLTGRTGIWLYSLNTGLEKPWFGNGIDSMWKVAPPFGPEMFEARHAENEMLQQFFAYGLAGVVMLAGIYGTLYRSIRGLPRSSTRAVLNGLVLFILIRGLAEAEPFDLLLPLWSIMLISSYVGFWLRNLKGIGNLLRVAT
ncbi:MAG: O-antigen ligase family protein [Terracidiphilus sp.]|jgi:O-antigen ligase